MAVNIRQRAKRTPGRTNEDTARITLRLDAEIVRELDEVAGRYGASRTSVVEALLQSKQTLDALIEETGRRSED